MAITAGQSKKLGALAGSTGWVVRSPLLYLGMCVLRMQSTCSLSICQHPQNRQVKTATVTHSSPKRMLVAMFQKQQPPENWQSGFDRSMFLFQERAGRLVSPFPGNPAKPTSQVSVSPAFPASFPCTHGQEVCQGHSIKILLEFTPHPNQTNQLGPIPNHASLRKTAKNPGSSPQAATCSRRHIPGI